MIKSRSAAKKSMLKMIAIEILPRTLAGRLTVLGFIFGIITATIPAKLDGISGSITLILFVWAFIAAVRNTPRKLGIRARLVRVSKIAVGIAVAYFGVRELAEALALMAISGGRKVSFALYSSTRSSLLSEIDLCLALVVALILVWVPQAFYRIQLDIDGTKDAQRVLLHLITSTSTIMTGIILLLFHFGDGAFRTINTSTFIVGVIGVMFLVAPPYRSLAKACWRRGIAGVFSPITWKQHWRSTRNELEEALNRTAK
jgi:hypothetical protein